MSLPLSIFMMSAMQFVLVGLWAYDGYNDKSSGDLVKSKKWITYPIYTIKTKISSLRNNKIALLIISLYLMHLIGLLFTNNFINAIAELRNKLPILVLTIIIASSKPFNKTQFNSLILLYIAAVLSGTFLGYYKFIEQDFTDVRELSLFIHPARFSLNICLSIFILVYFLYKKEFPNLSNKILFSNASN